MNYITCLIYYHGYYSSVNLNKILIMADMDILQIVADNIRIERLRKRISQEKLAELVGISTKYLNMIENKKANPTIVVVIKICQTLDITLETIFPMMG